MPNTYPNKDMNPVKSSLSNGRSDSRGRRVELDRTYTDTPYGYEVKTGKRNDNVDRFKYNGPA